MKENAQIPKQLPIGIENYKDLIHKCYYVDKTLLLKKLVDCPIGTSYLFTRPRRFGKSLTISMIQTFFESGEDPAPYFKGTKIFDEGGHYLSFMGAFPVIHLNLKDVKANTYEDFLTLMQKSLIEETERHRDLLNKLPKAQRPNLDVASLNETSCSFYLSDLMASLAKVTNQKVIVLIDEYDTPLEEAYQKGYYDRCVFFFRRMLGTALKGNENLRLSVLTGVLRIGKESLFSDLNNLLVNSVTDRGFGEYFGFTENETKEILHYYGYADKTEETKKWYDGYRFDEISVYNPWSILCYLQNEGLAKPYWANTAENPFLEKLLSFTDLSSEENIKALLNGSSIQLTLPMDVSFKDLEKNDSAIYSLLLSSGYLTATNTDVFSEYLLSFPNEEIKSLFRYEVLQRYSSKEFLWVKDYREILQSGDENKIGEFLKEKLLSLFSPYDFQDERNYQALLLGFMAVLYNDYVIQDELVSGEGRADIVLLPKDKGRVGFLYEFKCRKGKVSKKRLKAISENALRQIEEKHYDEMFHKEEIKSYILYGVAFAGKSVETTIKKID